MRRIILQTLIGLPIVVIILYFVRMLGPYMDRVFAVGLMVTILFIALVISRGIGYAIIKMYNDRDKIFIGSKKKKE